MEYDELKYFISKTQQNIIGNHLKDEIQTYCINKWLKESKSIGYLEAFTGFGKTHMVKKVFTRYRAKFIDNIIVVVPNTNLYNEFVNIGKELNLENYYVYVINTYTMGDDVVRNCGLFIVDELHRACGEFSDYFKQAIPMTNYGRFMGLSATLNNEHKEFLKEFEIECFFSISLEEGTRLNIVPEYEVINVGVDFTAQEKKEFYENDQIFKNYFKWFMLQGYNAFELMIACSVANGAMMKVKVSDDFGSSILTKSSEVWATIVANAHNRGDITYKVIKSKAVMASQAMRNRENIVNKAIAKTNFLGKALKILEEVNETKDENFIYSISFLNDSEQIKNLSSTKVMGYHSKITPKLRKDILNNFSIGVFRHLLTIKALDEGYDNKKVSVGFNLCYHSNIVTTIQRMGRIIRLDSNNPNKRGNFIFLYCKPFIVSEGDESVEVIPNDYKKLGKLQKNMLNVKYLNEEECLEMLRKL